MRHPAAPGTSIFALEELAMPHVVEFACDSDKHAKMFLDHNFRVNAFFDDCSAKSFLQDVPSCDILSAGPPCQSFSTQGLNLGLNDNRGLVMFDVIRYLKKFQPRPRCHRIARDLDYSADSGGQSARQILATITSAFSGGADFAFKRRGLLLGDSRPLLWNRAVFHIAPKHSIGTAAAYVSGRQGE